MINMPITAKKWPYCIVKLLHSDKCGFHTSTFLLKNLLANWVMVWAVCVTLWHSSVYNLWSESSIKIRRKIHIFPGVKNTNFLFVLFLFLFPYVCEVIFCCSSIVEDFTSRSNVVIKFLSWSICYYFREKYPPIKVVLLLFTNFSKIFSAWK